MTSRLSPALVAKALQGASTEWFLTDPLMFGLTTASDLQRAICRVSDGLPLDGLERLPEVKRAFGDCAALPKVPPREMAILSGIRTGKSLFAACAAVRMAMTCDVSRLRGGEPPRVSVLSLTKDLADVIFNHVIAGVDRSRFLKDRVVERNTDTLVLKHPTGMPVEIKVVAGSRAGSSLVARWSAGCIFDEFPRMSGADEGVVNWSDSRDAVLLRLLPGAQLLHVGSPWAPFGPAYELVTRQQGKPTRAMVVVKAPAYDMNPAWWTAEKVAEARADNPDAARTDVDAEFATPEEAMFSSASVDKCTRQDPVVIPPKQGRTYFAAMDPATRGNGWTFAIGTRDNGKAVVVRAEEFIGSREQPANPVDVLREIALLCAQYGVTMVHSDQVMGDALIAIGRQQGIHIAQWTYREAERAEKFLSIRQRLDLGEIELPPIPAMRTDLLHVRKRVTPTGMGVQLPLTSDGRHCDWAPTLMLVLTRLLPDPIDTVPGVRPEADAETLRLRKQLNDRMNKRGAW